MSRLLFAAARGARIQTQYVYPKRKWGSVAEIRTDDFYPYRIHPDDEHLQYGPISTAYLVVAEHPPMWPDVFMDNVGYLVTPYPTLTYYKKLSPIGKQFYLLLLSEYLADEGL
jgi:hypothetical protein